MARSFINSTHLTRSKRAGVNVGGSENNPDIKGSHNVVQISLDPNKVGEETLMRKLGQETGRIAESAADLASAPAKWINHMQDNW